MWHPLVVSNFKPIRFFDSVDTTVVYLQARSFFFVVAPCMLVVSSPLFVQLMHTNYYKIVKQLKSFKIIIVAPTCFGLHKPSLFEVIGIVAAYAATIPITSNNDM